MTSFYLLATLLAPPLLAERGYSISWAIILLSVILGLMVTLRPAGREVEFRRPKVR